MTYSSVKAKKVLAATHDIQAECIAAMIALALIAMITFFELDSKLNGNSWLSPAAKVTSPKLLKQQDRNRLMELRRVKTAKL